MTMLHELDEARRAEGAKIEPKNAEVTFWWTQVIDPYGDIPFLGLTDCPVGAVCKGKMNGASCVL